MSLFHYSLFWCEVLYLQNIECWWECGKSYVSNMVNKIRFSCFSETRLKHISSFSDPRAWLDFSLTKHFLASMCGKAQTHPPLQSQVQSFFSFPLFSLVMISGCPACFISNSKKTRRTENHRWNYFYCRLTESCTLAVSPKSPRGNVWKLIC